MDNHEPDFYMTSSDDDNFKQVRKCYRVKQIRARRRDDYLLIRVSPPYINLTSEDSSQINQLIIASRHRGVSLSSIRKWPVSVYVLQSLIDNTEQRDNLEDTEIELIGWAEIYPS